MHKSPSTSASMKEKFRLNGEVHNEGANFSAGERQLCGYRPSRQSGDCTACSPHAVVVLMRALARNSRVLLLDEATSSVDPETDALIQRIIQTQFANTTVGPSLTPLQPSADLAAPLNCAPSANSGIL